MVPPFDCRARREVALSEAHWRLFVSIAVPGPVRNEIEQVQMRMQQALKSESVRWTRSDQIHLTLRFLGNVPVEKIQDLTAALAQATSTFSAFDLRATGLGFFPPKRFPRVIWIGIESERDQLLRLQNAVARACEPFTAECEERSFSGHLTFGRVKRIGRSEAERLLAFRDSLGDRCFGSWQVSSVELMRSELEQAGARHTPAASFALRGEGL